MINAWWKACALISAGSCAGTALKVWEAKQKRQGGVVSLDSSAGFCSFGRGTVFSPCAVQISIKVVAWPEINLQAGEIAAVKMPSIRMRLRIGRLENGGGVFMNFV